MRMSIRAARVNKGLTQEDVAKELNVSKKTVWSWENGKSVPKVDKIEALCNLFGVKYDNINWSAT